MVELRIRNEGKEEEVTADARRSLVEVDSRHSCRDVEVEAEDIHPDRSNLR